jgi:hypothetical protein
LSHLERGKEQSGDDSINLIDFSEAKREVKAKGFLALITVVLDEMVGR